MVIMKITLLASLLLLGAIGSRGQHDQKQTVVDYPGRLTFIPAIDDPFNWNQICGCYISTSNSAGLYYDGLITGSYSLLVDSISCTWFDGFNGGPGIYIDTIADCQKTLPNHFYLNNNLGVWFVVREIYRAKSNRLSTLGTLDGKWTFDERAILTAFPDSCSAKKAFWAYLNQLKNQL
jgi:hypothetical protein